MTDKNDKPEEPMGPQSRQPRYPRERSVRRGPLARYQHGRISTRIVLDGLHDVSEGKGPHTDEWPSIIAELHARLLDPAGCNRVKRPSSYVDNILQGIEGQDGFELVKAQTVGSPQAALRATCEIARMIPDEAPTNDEGEAVTEPPEDLGDLAQDAADMARLLQKKGDLDAAQQAMDIHNEATKQQFNAAAARANAAGAAKRNVQRSISGVAQRAKEAKQGAEAAAMLSNMGGEGAGSGTGAMRAAEVDYDLGNALGRSAAVIAALRMAGAWLQAARGRTARRIPGLEGMTGHGVGGLADISDLTPRERLALQGAQGSAARLAALLRLLQGRAEKVEKGGGEGDNGDIVIALDCSGSMGMAGRYEKAIGFTVALAADRLARGRKVAVVPFDDVARTTTVFKRVSDLVDMMPSEPWAPGGGTCGVPAAMEECAKLADQWDGADVVALTDGFWPHSWERPANVKRMIVGCVGGCRPPPHPEDIDTLFTIHDGDDGEAYVEMLSEAMR